ncbi:recombinase family protein, partial [Streptomyces lunaelactis]|uniref:recombinase family protein n=1 Tax=Streptomyces lunaelactis TaxID=1535768 RepID=UPI00359FB9C7
MPRARRSKGLSANAPGMRAAICIRLSRETEESTSPERQRAACEALCEARGWQVIAAEEDRTEYRERRGVWGSGGSGRV